MEKLVKLERKVQSIYDKDLLPLAEKFQFQLPTSGSDAARRPCVLFLGNHSSGKSSFINYLIEDKVQKTGLAPTDDGFTIISYGTERDELDGQSVVTHPDLGLSMLRRLGPDFLSRLRMKAHPNDLLKSLTLIDSPGMIDSAAVGNTRGYDFESSVKMFAEASDLILFFFDPDKPGTTGETISMFTQTLAGMDHKLLIVVNKMDSFTNIRDFARTYGALCWNLSKMIKTKDVPQFFNTYIPGANPYLAQSEHRGIPLEDFDISREEVIHEIKRAPVRRADNLVSDLYNYICRLRMLTRVCSEASRQFRSVRTKMWWLAFALIVAGGAAVYGTFGMGWEITVGIAVGTVALAFGTFYGGNYLLQKKQKSFENIDNVNLIFEDLYRTDLAMGDRADLRGTWSQIKQKAMNTINVLGLEGLPTPSSIERRLRRLKDIRDNEIPKMRRRIAGASAEEEDEASEPETAAAK